MAETPRPRPARQSSTLPVRAQGCNSPALLDPKLLDMLAIDGAIVTIDAMGGQRAIARKICKGWYLTCRTLSDQVGTHGFRRLAWRRAVRSSPAPSAHRWRGSGA